MALGPLHAHVENFIYITCNGLPPQPKLECNPPLRRLKRLVAAARKHKLPLSLDVETGRYGHIAAFAELRLIGVGIALGRGWGMSWDINLLNRETRRYLKKVLADSTLPKLTMNGRAYDKVVCRRHGFKLRGPLEDIRALRRALSSTSKLSLAVQAAIYLRCRAWKAEAVEEEGDVKGYVSIKAHATKRQLRYNGEDCVRAGQVFQHQKKELKAKGERVRLIYEQVKRIEQVGADMMETGFLFDQDRARELAKELTDIFKKERRKLRWLVDKRAPGLRITNRGGVNENDLRALLYKDCAKPGIRGFNLEVPLSDICYTESGAPAVNRDALLFLWALPDTPDEVRQVIKQCWRVDAPLKAKQTYVVSEKVRDSIGPDGRVHGSINTCAAETYRWSMSRPNLFNISEELDAEDNDLRGELPNMRSLYVAKPGYVLVHRDWAALELNVMAEYTGDEILKKMLVTIDPLKGKPDPHSTRAREWFSIPLNEEVPHMIRRQGKVVGFASQYAAGVEGVFMQVLKQIQDITFEEVHAMWATFREKHVGIVKHWEDSLQFAEEFGYNEAPIMGYRRYYPYGTSIKPTETSNYAIQSGAAAIANSTLVGFGDEASWKKSLYYRLRREFPTARLVMHVYDSFDVECREHDADGVNQLMDECMAGPWTIRSTPKRYASDGKVGHRWSEV